MPQVKHKTFLWKKLSSFGIQSSYICRKIIKERIINIKKNQRKNYIKIILKTIKKNNFATIVKFLCKCRETMPKVINKILKEIKEIFTKRVPITKELILVQTGLSEKSKN